MIEKFGKSNKDLKEFVDERKISKSKFGLEYFSVVKMMKV
jgi:hypothetical protein